MVRLVICDVGEVVHMSTDVVPAIARTLGITREEFRAAMARHYKLLERGEIDVDTFWDHFSRSTGIRVSEDLLAKFFTPVPNPEMVSLIKQLKAEVRVVAGTNTFAPHYAIHLQRGDYSVFDAVYASHLMGVAKPDPGFYSYILDKESVGVQEAVHIDDNPVNVRAAEQYGLRAIAYTDPGAVRGHLQKLGLLNNA